MLDSTNAVGGTTARRRSPRRKHFIIGSGIALAALASTLTVSFLATAGTVTATASTKTSGTLVIPSGTALTGFLTTMNWASGSATTGTAASWTLAVGADGGVKAGGDIAMVDANSAKTTSTHVVISVYLANAPYYAKDVPTFDLPVELACGTATVSTTKFTAWSTWKWWNGTATSSASGETFLTNTSPYLTWDVTTAASKYCEVSLGGVGASLGTKFSGAVYLQSSGTSSTATYSPTFYVTAQRATS